MSRSEVSTLFNLIDKDFSGVITKEEWNEFHTVFIGPFQTYDIDGSGRLNLEEFKKSMKNSKVIN